MFWAFARNPLHAEEQTPVLFLGELLSIDIYDVHDFPFPTHFPVFHRIAFQFTHTDDSRENNDIPSIAVEYMDQIPHAAIP